MSPPAASCHHALRQNQLIALAFLAGGIIQRITESVETSAPPRFAITLTPPPAACPPHVVLPASNESDRQAIRDHAPHVVMDSASPLIFPSPGPFDGSPGRTRPSQIAHGMVQVFRIVRNGHHAVNETMPNRQTHGRNCFSAPPLTRLRPLPDSPPTRQVAPAGT